MPKYNRRKRVYRKKRLAPKRKGLAKMVRNIAKQVVHRNIENKQVCTQTDTLTLSSSLNTTGYDMLANIAQGAGQAVNTTDGQVQQRIVGLQFRAKYLEFTCTFLNHITNGSSIIRLMFVIDKQATNDDNLLLYSGSSDFGDLILQTDQIGSPLNGVGAKRYKVLYDKFHYLSNPMKEWKRVHLRIPLKNQVFQYYPTAVSSTLYELTKRLKMFCVATNGGLDDDTNPTIQYFSRVVYEDA